MPDKTWDIIPNRMSENISGGIIKNTANKKSKKNEMEYQIEMPDKSPDRII